MIPPLLSIIDLILTIQDDTIRQEALENIEKYPHLPLDRQECAVHMALYYSFHWSDTPQGWHYWNKIHDYFHSEFIRQYGASDFEPVEMTQTTLF